MAQQNEQPLIILLTGIMAAGKSTVAQEIAERLPKSVHLRGDIFRRMIVRGQAKMTTDLSSEARSQLSLRYKIAAQVAAMYFKAGFTVIYQDIILGEDLLTVVKSLDEYPLHLVVLCPNIKTVAKREAERDKIGYGDLHISAFDDELRQRTPRLGLWIDTSQQTAIETATSIIADLHQARLSKV